ncbi:MAG: Energy-coupling factor transporter ATP-binding protein EcfA2 [Candidatus Alkanophagales archaeon MCA70_species_2]|nr:Energy-coupling factor transporter ATP-binding protein EcfA2 [Candidatus Alkanophaga liquidiphilum]
MKRVIFVKDLEYAYPDDGTTALKGVNFEVFEGECVAILGPNGAGKSTLLLHLNGILQGKGEVEVLGMKISKENLRKIRSKVGLVFQNPDDQLFSLTVFDDVAFGPMNLGLEEEEVERRVKEALGLLGLEGYEERMPSHLSFGEKKKVAIATALAMKPEILVLDEPTSNLDPKARRELIELIRRLDLTKVIATHDIELAAELCDRLAIMFDGRIVKDGGLELLYEEEVLEAFGLEAPTLVKLLRRLGLQPKTKLDDAVSFLKSLLRE